MQEAKKLFTKLCAKLDALSHLSLVPKPVVSDLEVRVDTAAIAMEEAAPVTASVANLRAPEEVHAAVRAAPPLTFTLVLLVGQSLWSLRTAEMPPIGWGCNEHPVTGRSTCQRLAHGPERRAGA